MVLRGRTNCKKWILVDTAVILIGYGEGILGLSAVFRFWAWEKGGAWEGIGMDWVLA
jgi:hypothetical protein